ncbi:radical SAM protein [Verrucomicrobiota bacterium sgz303538]
MAGKNILLIEPSYKNKYPPLGLMKIAQYHGPEGKRDNVKFVKGEDTSVFDTCWDRIYVTTLFSFEWKKISAAIDFAIEASAQQPQKVFVGGIAASLMHGAFLDEKRWRGVRFIAGLLKESPAKSLQLDPFDEELYSDDRSGKPIEDLIPDYSILEQVNYNYPVADAYFAYASRGCIRKCSFCGVPKLEGDLYETPSLTEIVKGIESRYGPKKDLILMDNNVVASPRFREIIAEIRDLGFVPGAKLSRGRVPVQRRVDFNQGVDARILCKDPMFLKQLSSICLKPLRIAFDHIGVRKPYETAIRYANDVGLRDLSNYMLYNFHDSPADLYLRMRLNIDLNVELGTRIFSFPMRYQPTDMKDRSYVGEKWNRYYLRSMQIILQATHGIVSGSPDFFKRAFGKTVDEFEQLLIRPQHLLFNRDWYEESDGREEFDRYTEESNRLSATERTELLNVLADYTPKGFDGLKSKIANKRIQRIFEFYQPLSEKEESEIWAQQRQRKLSSAASTPEIPDDERVEDAGLELDATLKS